jgi:hypothetical protein
VKAYGYDPAEVIITIVAPPIVIPQLQGLTASTFIRARRAAPRYQIRPGIDDLSRRRSRRRDGLIEFVLDDVAPHNTLLAAMHAADDVAQSGIAGILVRDRKKWGDVVVATQAWITGPPDYEKGAESGTVTWAFECGDIEIFHGAGRQLDGLELSGPLTNLPFPFGPPGGVG